LAFVWILFWLVSSVQGESWLGRLLPSWRRNWMWRFLARQQREGALVLEGQAVLVGVRARGKKLLVVHSPCRK